MTEAALITPTAEKMMSVTSGTPAVPVSAASEGIFAGMLAQRLSASAEPLAKSVAVDTVRRPMAVAEGLSPGSPSPQDGNVLPLQVATPAVLEAEPTMPAPGLSLLRMAELSSGAGSDAVPLETAQPDTLVQYLPPPGVVVDASTPLPAGVTPLPDVKSQPLPGDRPASVDEHRPPPGRAPLPVAPPLAGLSTAQPVVMLDPQQQPASLGLNARGETLGMLRGNIPGLPVKQAVRGGMVVQHTNQTLAGGSLPHQFQQQIDRLLATTRLPTDAGLSTPILAPSDTLTSVTPPDLSATAFLPGIAGDGRGAVVSSPALLPGQPVNTPVSHPGWSAELGQRMVWLANQEIREAQIQLNPRHLGPIDVRIVYSDAQQLSVSFHAQNPVAREALDAALPRLREMFEQQGLNLSDSSVSQESFAGQQQNAENENTYSSHAATDAATHRMGSGGDESRQRPPPVPIGLGLLDTFA